MVEHVNGKLAIKRIDLKSGISVKVTKSLMFSCADSPIIYDIMAFNQAGVQIDGTIAKSEKEMETQAWIFCNRWKDGEDAHYLRGWDKKETIKNSWKR